MSTGQVEAAPGRGRRVRRVAGLIGALAILTAVGTAQATAASLPQLHVGSERIRDGSERQVLLRGVNDTSLTDQYQVNPSLPTVTPLEESDYEEMQSLGFNVIRLGINWSALEPERGEISEEYIQRIADVVHNAADHGMYVVLDMHSGGWGKYVATPPDEKCPKGLRPSHGWMGAPKWATFIGVKTTCHDDKTNKRTPAARQAWTKFWQNYSPPSWGKKARGIQDHLVTVWATLAREFAGERAVAGYDLLNEPDPGYVGHGLQRFYRSRFDRHAIRAIRRSERKAHGFHHLVLFEANLTWSQHGLASHSPKPGFSHDRNLVYAPHLYGRDVHSTARPLKGVKRDLHRQAKRITALARQYHTPWWIGEWSFSQFDQDSFKKMIVHSKIQDSMALGSAWWQWSVACGAPQTFDDLDPTPTHRVLGNINPTKCPEGTPRPRPKRWKGVIGRAYPRFSPGRIAKLRSRGQRMRMNGKSDCTPAKRSSSPKACKLVVWIPSSQRPKLRGHHLRNIRIQRQPGGWTATMSVRRDYTVRTR